MSFFLLRRTSQRINKKRLYGFDIETYGKENKFYCASVWNENFSRTYMTVFDFYDDMISGVYNDSIIVATNLGFDFFGTFFGKDYIKDFNTLFRGSDLLTAKTYVYNNRLNKKSNRHKNSITFLDTMNYAQMSVEKLGEMLKIPKMKKPACLGKKPRNKKEKDYLIKYNMRDAEISCRALYFLYATFESLGASPKLTLSSTAMSLFKNRYLKREYWRHREDVLIEQFEGYYGGRTEAFKRGNVKDMRYYDINSLYPFVMLNRYPDPNTLRTNHKDTLEYIKKYEGMSKVKVTCPYMRYPLLPYRFKDGDTKSAPMKLLFPCGTFEGWHTHVELRHALKLGYTIDKVYKCHYYLKTCRPFSGYVRDMYKKRLEYKSKGSPMEKVVKILMNGLYGKFGQKFQDKENLIPFNHTPEELARFDWFEHVGDFIRIKEDRIPASFCIPIWASYVTSYGRLELYKYLTRYRAYYCDTDSVTIKGSIPENKELGGVKCEIRIKRGVIIKPKFYAHVGVNFKDHVRVKGVGVRMNFKDFGKLVTSRKVSYTKFIKVRESLRRKKLPNEVIDVVKELDLEDTKREWHDKYDGTLQDSEPVYVGCTMEDKKFLMMRRLGEALKEFETLSHDEKVEKMKLVPLKQRMILYCKFLDNDELKQLVYGWRKDGEHDKVKLLQKRLKRERRPVSFG